MYRIIAIRDFPRLPCGFRGSYVIPEVCSTIEEARAIAEEERIMRGKKYGFLFLKAKIG